jgi:Na+-driven multidrug efflux pump
MKKLKQFFNGFQKGVKSFGGNISTIINFILLSIVYLIGVGLTSITAKIFGKHFLNMKKKKNSYWIDLNLKKKPINKYYRQF